MKYLSTSKGYYYRELEGGDKVRISEEEFTKNEQVRKHTVSTMIVSSVILIFTSVVSSL
tara:strand:+ start:36 stop:212 length:177 start_codon:yes stop_codon:yes gene_type:complete